MGSAGNELLHGGSGNDVISGDTGADSLMGGDGYDLLISGSSRFYEADYTPRFDGGLFQSLDVTADVLEGGDGNDTLFAGPGTSVTGGDGDDVIRTFALDSQFVPDHDPEFSFSEPLFITGFEPVEVQLLVGAVDPIALNDQSTFATLTYDPIQDQTALCWGGQSIAVLNGQHDGLIIVYDEIDIGELGFEEVVTTDGTVLFDLAEANDALQRADIVIGGYNSTNEFIDPYQGGGCRGA